MYASGTKPFPIIAFWLFNLWMENMFMEGKVLLGGRLMINFQIKVKWNDVLTIWFESFIIEFALLGDVHFYGSS